MQWGTVRLSTEHGEGMTGDLVLGDVLYMPGMQVNILSLQRMRDSSCEYTFSGKPQPRKIIPIFNSKGGQIASMKESAKGKPTLIGRRVEGGGRPRRGGEVYGAKGVSMELLHKRLGHTSKSGMERLVREQMVRGLEEGMQGDLGMCRGCQLGRLSEHKHPRKSPAYRASEQLALVHTNLARPFRPAAIGGGGEQVQLGHHRRL